jgi:predicted RNA polymerase sigma factor
VLELLDAEPDFVFTLDGQLATVDDYLELRPEREERIRELVREGRLAVGPWQILMDEFLVSGETIVRNLEAGLARAEALGGALGPFTLQAAIAACHVRAATAEATDWPRIAALYDALGQLAPSPVVELNRAVAVAMAYGPAAGLEVVDGLLAEPALSEYHLLPSVRADLLARLGRADEAREELTRAAGLARNARERELLLARAAALA